jgi:hypothetical protein
MSVCDVALVSALLCVDLIAIFFVVLRFSPVFFSIGVYFVVPHSWCGVSRLLVEFLRVQASVCHGGIYV